MRHATPERQERLTLYGFVRLVYLADHLYCECGCGRFATEIHHKAGKEGWLLCAREWFMAINWCCHRWITDNGLLAKERGWKLEAPLLTREKKDAIRADAEACRDLLKGLNVRQLEPEEARRAILERTHPNEPH